MDAESFTDLALRVIAGEATAEERRALESECSSNFAHREDFKQLKLTHDTLRTTAPMTEAARATEPGLPAHRVYELRTAVRQHFGPATNRAKPARPFANWIPAFRWFFFGSGAAGIGFAVVIFFFANNTIEVGVYGTDPVRGDQGLSASDVPSAKIIAFSEDAPFDQWQNEPLAWNEHAKIWVDNERDLLHIVRRVSPGHIQMETHPLATTNAAQREQIKQAVESLKN